MVEKNKRISFSDFYPAINQYYLRTVLYFYLNVTIKLFFRRIFAKIQ